MSDSLAVTDQLAAAAAVAPRVTLESIKEAIAGRYHMTGLEAVHGGSAIIGPASNAGPLSVLSICILVMRNGFTVIGKSAPASVENFNAELGRKFAYEDAIRQLWPLMGFCLREQLSWEEQGNATQAKKPT